MLITSLFRTFLDRSMINNGKSRILIGKEKLFGFMPSSVFIATVPDQNSTKAALESSLGNWEKSSAAVVQN